MIAAQALGLWHTTDIKETVYWFFGTGVLLVGRAIKSASNSNWPRMILCPALRLAPALTLASFPILFVVVHWVRWDTAAVRRRWQADIDSV